MGELSGKTILVGVTGGIAAYKTPNLVSLLVQKGADVHVLLTENAKNIIPPVPFEALTGNRCLSSPFERSDPPVIHHIALAKKADLVIIAPASADVIGKCAGCIADDMLTSTILACQCPIYFAPAMNDRMYINPIVQENMEKLRRHGWRQIDPVSGHLACGTDGLGKMPDPRELYQHIRRELACPHDMAGVKLLVTAGATREPIDPVRYITNHSSGRMGCAVAEAAMLRGADVTLVAAGLEVEPPPFVTVVRAMSAEEMFAAVTARAPEMDLIVKSAAVADYTPAETAAHKIKKSDGDLSLPLKRTKDILAFLGEHKKEGQLLCGFSMETENLLENSRKKLVKKNLDMIAANSLNTPGAGFQGETNVLTLITREEEVPLPLMGKFEAAMELLTRLMAMRSERKA